MKQPNSPLSFDKVIRVKFYAIKSFQWKKDELLFNVGSLPQPRKNLEVNLKALSTKSSDDDIPGKKTQMSKIFQLLVTSYWICIKLFL